MPEYGIIDYWAEYSRLRLMPQLRDQRCGQIAFNLLSDVRPDLSEQIRGTDRDPFHSDEAVDMRFVRFVDFIHDNW